MHTIKISTPTPARRGWLATSFSILRHFLLYCLLPVVAGLVSCENEADPQPITLPPTVVERTVPVQNGVGQPLVNFVFTQTTTTVAPGKATAVLDVQVQNVSSCTLSFPYTITVGSTDVNNSPVNNIVNYKLQGSVANLPVNTTVEVHHQVSTTPADFRQVSISITPIGLVKYADCPIPAGLWTGQYLVSADTWDYERDEERGATQLTIPATGPLELAFTGYNSFGQLSGMTTKVTGTLNEAHEFTGSGQTSFDNEVIGSIKMSGLISPTSPDPLTGKKRLSVGLIIGYTEISKNLIALTSIVTMQ
ncbi:hypothetical protein SAMN00120144_2153 [Hymenobacter roseosalivarius DSM 11622]|uniref:Uncharacterized protein n=1 Tax=Hymenobacter roseosalivarius DSM 11622 TaxID=645990 RepID=A0A1W1VGH6_9BACT|nr:hypothetical protein [Hymenobacter roseosalivarius]SMB92416.1 hypothetical protein SAMN00120144_2153 [Hymenobacter roseosalivarius DSM 11622]